MGEEGRVEGENSEKRMSVLSILEKKKMKQKQNLGFGKEKERGKKRESGEGHRLLSLIKIHDNPLCIF